MQEVVSRPTRLAGTVTPPGDKSISHRAAIFNAIAEGQARVQNFCPGADGASTLRVLRQLGVEFEQDGLTLAIAGGALQEPVDVLDTGNSGTTTRLMAGVLAGQPFLSVLTGDHSIRARPMGRIVTPLRLMGADVLGRDGGNLAPLAISGGHLRGIRYRMPVASAQLKTALLLAGLFAEGETVLEQPALSRDHTELLFGAMGVPVREDGLTLTLSPGRLCAVDVTVPADISSAAYWLVAGVCHPNAEVRVKGVGINPSRTGILDALRSMGADITIEDRRTQGGELVADLVARSGSLEAIDVGGDMVPRLIDEIPVLALAACFARGTTVIRDAQELRVKESDRIATTTAELSRLGGLVEGTDDGLRITGVAKLTGAVGESHADHRIAMTLGVAGLLAGGTTTIQGAETASVSYPSFWSDLRTLAPEGVWA
jgi:3-phosphoshikimate 1-carboxyvinyltransferase